jgi:hypothetical protein
VYGAEGTRYSSNGLNSDFLFHILRRNKESLGDEYVFTPRIFLRLPSKMGFRKKIIWELL